MNQSTKASVDVFNDKLGHRIPIYDSDTEEFKVASPFKTPLKRAAFSAQKTDIPIPDYSSPLKDSFMDMSAHKGFESFLSKPVEAPVSSGPLEEDKYKRLYLDLLSKYEASTHNDKDQIIIGQLNERIQLLQKSNEMHKEEIRQQKEEYITLLNSQDEIKRENELLRSKLIKYKSLYEGKSNPAFKPHKKNKNKKIELYNEMADILNKQKKKYSYSFDSESEDEDTGDLRAQFQKILHEHNLPGSSGPRGSSGSQGSRGSRGSSSSTDKDAPNASNAPNALRDAVPVAPDASLDKLAAILESNQKIYQKISDLFDKQTPEIPPHEAIAANNKQENNKHDILVKCFVCCRNMHDVQSGHASGHSKHKPVCSRCSSNGSDNYRTASKSKSPTGDYNIDLMGEYKWSL